MELREPLGPGVQAVVAPGLRVGRGLEPLHGRLQEPQGQGCARPSGRARIGTRNPPQRDQNKERCARPSGRARIGTPSSAFGCILASGCARPSGRARIGTTSGGGSCRGPRVAPGLRVGRGLERQVPPLGGPGRGGCARPSGRARIGTPPTTTSSIRTGSCARPSGRARVVIWLLHDVGQAS